MGDAIKILVVEDEMVIAANIALQLGKLGYEVTSMETNANAAFQSIKRVRPDIILLDIHLKGNLDGIDMAHLVNKDYHIPVIFLTANIDDAHFNRAKATNPSAFISKPFKNPDLYHAIELTLSRVMENRSSPQLAKNIYALTDCIFVKEHTKMVKVLIDNILYLEADRNYCRIFCHEKEYLLVATLKDMEEKMPPEIFQRIHRSYMVNITKLNEIATDHVVIAGKPIPLSKDMRANLLQRLHTI